ncbi:uncharacterized protein [Amphiura filiformis]|uniref:uncharacterized protein isoform X2 n=1 Tax=Amphiura filiformis TaxID=82378 RepID=UPI003B220D97
MDKRYTFRTYNIPAAANISTGSKTKIRPYRLRTLFGIACVILVMFQIWGVEKYIAGHPASLQNVQSWSHLIFHATGDKQIKNTKLTHSTDSTQSTNSSDQCTYPRFDPKTEHPPYVTCRRNQPPPDSCKKAQKMYFSKPTPLCTDKRQFILCQIQNFTTGHRVTCNGSICETPISLGVMKEGNLSWSIFPDINDLQNTILDFLTKNSSTGNYGFCYLNCTLKDKKLGSQLLLIPQYFTQNTCKDKACFDAININVIWMDSTSHSHFFRSLPKSVTALRNAKENKLAHVFNYDLMQSMYGRTYANTMMFTLGPPGDPWTGIGPGIGKLFKLFQNGGYHVTWIDDLCWITMMQAGRKTGMSRFIGIDKADKSVSKSWKTLLKTLKSKGIDQIGSSAANCEILKNSDRLDPFHDEPNQAICYNGKYQGDYMLSYMASLQNQFTNVTRKRPFFNYLEFNTAHEPTGCRLQTLDESFAKFIDFLNKQSNTFTFIFGDHGLGYGNTVKDELQHPACFIHASNDLDEKLGKEKMDSLSLNQERLIDIVDLRQTLLTLAPGDDKSIYKIDKKIRHTSQWTVSYH